MGTTARNTIITLCTGVSLLIILDSLNAGHALAMFLLAGVIPGTNITISGARMFEFFMLIGGFTLARITLLALKRHNTLSPQL